MTLLEKQQRFFELVLDLGAFCRYLGYQVTWGETYRPPEMAVIYAKEGKGITHSLHSMRLAVDINLFKKDEYLTDLDTYRPVGEWWKKKSTDEYTCCWGGDFETPDMDHFSLEHNLIK